MKKILLLFIIAYLVSFFIVFPAYAETCIFDNAGADGAWHTAANWDCGAGHTEKVPVANDDVVLSAAATWVPASGTRIPATSGALGTITSTGAFGITIDVDSGNTTCDTKDVCSINFTTATALEEDLFNVTGTSTAADITFNGTTINASAATANKSGIYHNSNNMLWINCALVGSSGNSGDGLRLNAAGSASIAGNITGGAGNGGVGVNHAGTGSSTLTVTSGIITGGSYPVMSSGITNSSSLKTTGIVISSGVLLVNTTNGSGAITGTFTWNATAGSNSYWQIGALYVSPAPAKTKVTSDQSIVIFDTGAYEAGTASSGGGGAYAY